VRCFAYVTDVVHAILALMACDAAVGRVFNVGSDQPISIGELARQVVAAIDPRLPICFQSYTVAFGADFEDCRRRVPNLARLRQTIDWQPRYDLEQILRSVIAWRRERLPHIAPS
jgi:UDP-glucose 4-epimerase